MNMHASQMKIREVIRRIKASCYGMAFGSPIDEEKTRDKVLYGSDEVECTGIVTTCFANTKVIEAAHRCKANLIISHEALFWNHGDHTEWLADNEVFQKKKALLDQYGITVWRFHDYIHSGVPIGNGKFADGIFYGFMKVMGWESYLLQREDKPLVFAIPETTAEQLGHLLITRLGLNGIKVIGNPAAKVRKVYIAEHIQGRDDNQKISKIAAEDIDAILTLELIDFTVTEYVRDAALLGFPKTILCFGHFNTEEPGMQYLPEYLPAMIQEQIPVQYVQSGDMYNYLTAEHQEWK